MVDNGFPVFLYGLSKGLFEHGVRFEVGTIVSGSVTGVSQESSRRFGKLEAVILYLFGGLGRSFNGHFKEDIGTHFAIVYSWRRGRGVCEVIDLCYSSGLIWSTTTFTGDIQGGDYTTTRSFFSGTVSITRVLLGRTNPSYFFVGTSNSVQTMSMDVQVSGTWSVRGRVPRSGGGRVGRM